jgi:hypothetical protein
MIALLVCALGEAFEGLEGNWKLDADPKDQLPAPGRALKSDRENYLTLMYKKV